MTLVIFILLITKTHFVKVSRLDITDCTIKNTINTIANKRARTFMSAIKCLTFGVIKGNQNTKLRIVDSSIETHGNYARNKPRAVSSCENPVRANGGKPMTLPLI